MSSATRRPTQAVTAVLLAAGGSSRLGKPKQLVRLRAEPLLRRAVDAAAAATGGSVIVVVGADALRLRALLARTHAQRTRVVAHPGWAEGLSSSLRRGLAAVPAQSRGVLFVLADQPLVDARSLERLIAAWRRRPSHAAAARYAGRLGVPAIVPRRAFAALRSLKGDEGARRVLAQARGVVEVEMPEAEIDVDTPQDLVTLAHARATPRSMRRGPARRSRS
jgi:molybdenum cofactor cytidylyltransferase